MHSRDDRVKYLVPLFTLSFLSDLHFHGSTVCIVIVLSILLYYHLGHFWKNDHKQSGEIVV